MGFFGGIGKAIKSAGGAIGMGGGNRPPVAPAAGAGMAGAGLSAGQWGGMGAAGPAMAPGVMGENIRTLKGGGASEADAVRMAYSPRMRPRMPMPGGGFGRQGGGMMYPGGSKTFDESAGGGQGPILQAPGAGLEDALMQRRVMGQAQ